MTESDEAEDGDEEMEMDDDEFDAGGGRRWRRAVAVAASMSGADGEEEEEEDEFLSLKADIQQRTAKLASTASKLAEQSFYCICSIHPSTSSSFSALSQAEILSLLTATSALHPASPPSSDDDDSIAPELPIERKARLLLTQQSAAAVPQTPTLSCRLNVIEQSTFHLPTDVRAWRRRSKAGPRQPRTPLPHQRPSSECCPTSATGKEEPAAAAVNTSVN